MGSKLTAIAKFRDHFRSGPQKVPDLKGSRAFFCLEKFSEKLQIRNSKNLRLSGFERAQNRKKASEWRPRIASLRSDALLPDKQRDGIFDIC